MKKIFPVILLFFLIFSCSKQEFTQTTDTIKRADSLFTKANDGLKTLDSISKNISDSNGIAKKVIIPKIEKQTKRIDSTLKSGSWRIDSLNKEITKITKHVKTGTEVAKTLDSASQLLKNGENAIAVLSKTADRILKQTQEKKEAQPETPSAPPVQREETAVNPTPKDPLIKKTFLEIEVEDLSDAKALLRQQLRDSNGNLVSENFTTSEGIKKENLEMRIPMRDFDYFVQSISAQLGDVTLKNTTSRGSDLMSNTSGSVEITLIQKNHDLASGMPNSTIEKPEKADENDSFSSKSSSAFNSGFEGLEKIFLALLPFWPVFVFGGIIFLIYFKTKNQQKSPPIPTTENIENLDEKPAENLNEKPKNSNTKTEDSEPDYSKYLPKK
ncbi:hypothetical protein OA84_07655 [Kaistella solincola]|uniref:DUF4349 domain-containing protein n=1 Tax=Kaistella solincola TaxID=510955 RepID=A0ABR4ZQ15_9FLAO|nr:DUF4349 domain-containing protein [Kaistella solincola]KIA83388.1 hypothetical protein OA84_07655 [Kaistella solincola]